jgi:hypothetical protein
MGSLWFKDIAKILKHHYGKYYKIKTGELKYCTIKLAGLFDAKAKLAIPYWGIPLNCSNKKSEQILNINYSKRPIEETLKDVAQSFIEQGVIKNKIKTSKKK